MKKDRSDTKRDEKSNSVIDMDSIINSRYRILGELGSGGFGRVYRAYDQVLKKEVALKFLSPNVINSEKKFIRVKREINISQKITDKRIVKIFSLEKWKDNYYLVMELAKGRTLKEILQEKGKLRWKDFKSIFLEIIRSVEALHENNIVHRDIKPSNIMISADGSVKLLDFGLSKEVTDMEKTSSIGEVVGSPYYMSPEQISVSNIDARSDIYQLGLVLYETLSGDLPFAEVTSTMAVLLKRISERAGSFREKGIKVEKFIEIGVAKALEKERRNRFQTAAEMEEYFLEERAPWFGKSRVVIRRHPAIFVSILIFLIVVTGAGFFLRKESETFGKIEYEGSRLTAFNGLGKKLFEKDYSPFTIVKPVIHRISKNFSEMNNRYVRANFPSSDEDVIALFLTKKDLYREIINKSITSKSYPNSVYLVNKKGETVFEQTFHLSTSKVNQSEFSPWMNFQKIKKEDVDEDGVEELVFETCHNMSMFPAQLVVLDDTRFYMVNSPGHFDLISPIKKKGSYNFLIIGKNNPFSHMAYIADLDMRKKNRYLIYPDLLSKQYKPEIDYTFIILPQSFKISENMWRDEGVIKLTDPFDSSIITVRKNGELIVEKGKEIRRYRDEPEIISNVIGTVQSVYNKELSERNYKDAGKMMDQLDLSVIHNPYLLSALYLFKADVDIHKGYFGSAKEFLGRSLYYYGNNHDAIQKEYELRFLKDDNSLRDLSPEELVSMGVKFYGLFDIGVRMFSSYVSLHFGDMRKAERTISSIIENREMMVSMLNLFMGDYGNAFRLLSGLNGKRTAPFTLEEVRLMLARAILLSYLFEKPEKRPSEKSMKLAGFYFKDIADNSFFNKHFADISLSLILAGSSHGDDLPGYTKERFDKLIKFSRGDMLTKLWLFYDSFVYGMTMEKLGDMKEAVRGYKMCIKANPHTDLARRAKKALERFRL